MVVAPHMVSVPALASPRPSVCLLEMAWSSGSHVEEACKASNLV